MPEEKIISTAIQSQEDAIQGLLDYCKEQSIYISPSIAARNFPGRGLGVYAVRPIKKGERLIHVPTKALLTTKSIPNSFLPKGVQKRITVHCALAAYLAFGADEDLAKYRRWMATWPRLEEFTDALPVFWLEDFRKLKGTVSKSARSKRATKRRKTLSDGDVPSWSEMAPRFSRSAGIDDHWLTIPSITKRPGELNHIAKQADKIRVCISAICKHLPQIDIRADSSHAAYLRFLYMWSCVNSRCFYYLRPGQSAPEDSNEAMALCPFQDLFNHSDTTGCVGIFDKHGFFVTADRDYKEGEELFLTYGKHSNDMLWMEYGFTMDVNQDDYLEIDPAVLESFDTVQMEKLKSADYLGDFILKSDGVCYRTTIASYLSVLDADQWTRMISGGFDPETSTAYAMTRLKAKRRVVKWIMKVRKEAEENLKVLLRMGLSNEKEFLRAFVDEASLTAEQRASTTTQTSLATKRKEMCIRRWMQVFDMCMNAVREIEKEYPGSFSTTPQDTELDQDLACTAQQMLEALQKETSRH